MDDGFDPLPGRTRLFFFGLAPLIRACPVGAIF